MQKLIETGCDIVDELGKWNITGNIIPHNWYRHITRENGKPYLLAVTILSEFVYWYRPTEVRDESTGQITGYRKRFRGDFLQKSYAQLAEEYGEGKSAVKRALDCLEETGVIERIWKTVSVGDDLVMNNVLFIRAETYNLGNLAGDNMIVDIGNGTMNIARIVDGSPVETSLATENHGVSICIREIQNALSKKIGRNIDERIIEPLLRDGCDGRTDDVAGVIRQIAGNYVREIEKRLAVYGYVEEYVNLFVFGGGGCLLKNYSEFAGKKNVVFNDDICANAKGYEYLAARKTVQSAR